MDFILTPADPEGQRALPDDPGTGPQCGACAWHRNGTYARDLVVLGRLQVQCWQCQACLGSASPLPPGVGAATLWQDVQAVAPGPHLSPWIEVNETRLSIGGVKRPVAVVPGPKGERLDLRLSGLGFVPASTGAAGSRVWPRAGCGS